MINHIHYPGLGVATPSRWAKSKYWIIYSNQCQWIYMYNEDYILDILFTVDGIPALLWLLEGVSLLEYCREYDIYLWWAYMHMWAQLWGGVPMINDQSMFHMRNPTKGTSIQQTKIGKRSIRNYCIQNRILISQSTRRVISLSVTEKNQRCTEDRGCCDYMFDKRMSGSYN